MSGPISVDTIHLNIGIGDCSIVCKTQPPPSSSTTSIGKPQLLSAVLIDGGFQASADLIQKCIQTQLDGTGTNSGLYDLSLMPGSVVKFDSVVITHWDQDHWGGLINLICDDLKTQLNTRIQAAQDAEAKKEGKEWKDLTKDEKDAIEVEIVAANTAAKLSTDPVVPEIQCAYFKYDGLPGVGKPLTTLYVPYWDAVGSASKPGSTMNNSNRLGNDYGAVFDIDIRVKAGRAGRWILSLCRLSYTSAMNLGKNILKPLDPKDPPITNFVRNGPDGPTSLARFLNLGAGQPALVIVACDNSGVWEYGPSPPTVNEKAVVVDRTKVTGEPFRSLGF